MLKYPEEEIDLMLEKSAFSNRVVDSWKCHLCEDRDTCALNEFQLYTYNYIVITSGTAIRGLSRSSLSTSITVRI